jgi:riboflavin transporter FmnP
VFYIYGPRVLRALHTPILLLIAATAVPDTIPELVQKGAQRIIGAVAVLMGKFMGDTFTFDAGSQFNVADDYLRSGSLNAPIAAPMNGLALMTTTVVIGALWTLKNKRGIASTAVAKLVGVAVSSVCVLAHILVIVTTLHNGQRGYTVASLHNILLLPLTATVTILVLKKVFASSFGTYIRTLDRQIVIWFVNLPDIRRKSLWKRQAKPKKSTKAAPPMLGVLFRMALSPFRYYWRLMTRIDTSISKWERGTSRNKRPRR